MLHTACIYTCIHTHISTYGDASTKFARHQKRCPREVGTLFLMHARQCAKESVCVCGCMRGIAHQSMSKALSLGVENLLRAEDSSRLMPDAAR